MDAPEEATSLPPDFRPKFVILEEVGGRKAELRVSSVEVSAHAVLIKAKTPSARTVVEGDVYAAGGALIGKWTPRLPTVMAAGDTLEIRIERITSPG